MLRPNPPSALLRQLVACGLACFCATVFLASSRAAALPVTSFEKAFLPLFSKNLKKSEYETAAQYQERLNHLRPEGEVFVEVDPNNIEYRYLPEQKSLLVGVDFREGNNCLIVHRQTAQHGHQVMQNAYGVKASVSKESARQNDFIIQNRLPRDVIIWLDPRSEIALSLYLLGLPVPLSPDVARQRVKEKAYSVVVGVRVGDLSRTQETRSYYGATLSDRQALSVHDFTVSVNLEHVLLLYRPTHSIVSAWSATAGLGPAAMPKL